MRGLARNARAAPDSLCGRGLRHAWGAGLRVHDATHAGASVVRASAAQLGGDGVQDAFEGGVAAFEAGLAFAGG